MKRGFTLLSLFFLMAFVPLFQGCPETEKTEKFFVAGLDVMGREDVRRNQHIAIEFNKHVDPMTVNHDTIKVFSEKAPNEWEPFFGRFEAVKNRVLFYPTVLPEDFNIDGLPLNAKGFEPDTRYKMVVHGFFCGLSSTIKSADEFEPLSEEFVGSFQTSASFEEEWEPPAVLYINIMEIMEEAGNEFPSGVLSAKFSEPMDENSVREGIALTHDLSGEVLPVRCVPNKDYTLFTLVPRRKVAGVSLKKDYTLYLGQEISDLVGNFLLEFHTGETLLSHEGLKIVEDFTTKNFLDERETSLRWCPLEMPGFLRSTGDHSVVDVKNEGPPAIDGELFWSQESQKIQIFIPAEGLGAEGVIEEIGWMPLKKKFIPSFFSNTVVFLGYAGAPSYDGGFIERTPTYSPSLSPEGYIPLPFTRPFFFNGEDSLVLVISHDGGTGCIPWKLWGAGEYGLRIKFKQESQSGFSKFYDTRTLNPLFRSPPIVFSRWELLSVCAEETFILEFQGSQVLNPDGSPSAFDCTEFLKAIDRLENYRYIRFRITFLTDVPSFCIDSMEIPYTW